VVTPGLVAQKNDPHFATQKIASTAKRSAFVHGYLHGYEEGFHQADFDLQMGHIARGDYTRDASPTGYKHQFGSKQMYNTGYHNGFEVGYADSARGRSFRALGTVEAATGNAIAENDPKWDGVYDEGVMSGYIAGQHQGLSDARSQVQSNPSPACPVKDGKDQADFCTAYVSGYNIGYSDGFTNQAKTAVAEKQ
jgi:hypothetical protein